MSVLQGDLGPDARFARMLATLRLPYEIAYAFAKATAYGDAALAMTFKVQMITTGFKLGLLFERV